VNSYTLHIIINYNNYAYNSLMKTHQDVMKRKLNEAEMKTILLIEDNYQILENFTEYLEMEGYNILGASNGKKGVELAMEFLPDLIICDVLMPGMDGHEVLYLLLATSKTHEIPFIFSTSMSEKVDRNEALALGADDYIIKPFDMELLLKMINAWLKKGSNRKFSPGIN
jgi:DNA-binding response OmpR family regulator